MRRRYFVYVVDLRPLTSGDRHVYVGSSALPPSERFRKHLSGDRGSSRHVRMRGRRLLPDLYRGLNPLPSREAAKAAEQGLKKRLERQGYKVFGACSSRQEPDCWL